MSKIAIISLTELALEQLLRIKSENNISSDFALRVGVKGGGGCSGGFTYVLGFDQIKDNDEEFEISGIKVYIDKAQSLYLFGMEIDWFDGDGAKGFVFNNPQAKETEGNNFTI